MAITLNGTTGITTPDIDTDGLSVDTNAIFVDPATKNVGIGTGSPGTKLEVARGSEGEYLRVGGDDAANARALRFTSSALGGNPGAIHTINASSFVGTLAFATANIERARIIAGGSLLMGTTSTFDGSAKIQVQMTGTNTGITTKSNSGSNAFALGFYNINGLVGGIVTSGSGTSYLTSSDYRLKENLVPIPDALARVSAIPVYRFNFKADPTKTVDGFLAHEAQAVVPEAVTGEKDAVDKDGNPVHQGIDQSKLVPLLTAAIQEQQTLIQALTARIEALEQEA